LLCGQVNESIIFIKTLINLKLLEKTEKQILKIEKSRSEKILMNIFLIVFLSFSAKKTNNRLIKNAFLSTKIKSSNYEKEKFLSIMD